MPNQNKDALKDDKNLRLKISTFFSHYGRDGSIDIFNVVCDVCKEIGDCICIDSSEGEYGAGCICKKCIDDAFGRMETR